MELSRYGKMKKATHVRHIDEEIDRLIARLKKSQRKHRLTEDTGWYWNRRRSLDLGVAIEASINALEEARWRVKRH